jgi:hypothetical protein
MNTLFAWFRLDWNKAVVSRMSSILFMPRSSSKWTMKRSMSTAAARTRAASWSVSHLTLVGEVSLQGIRQVLAPLLPAQRRKMSMRPISFSL